MPLFCRIDFTVWRSATIGVSSTATTMATATTMTTATTMAASETAAVATAKPATESTMPETLADDMMTAKATAMSRASNKDATPVTPAVPVAIPGAVSAVRAPSVALISGGFAADQPERDCDHQRRE